MALLQSEGRSWVIATETRWPPEPKIFTTWLFAESSPFPVLDPAAQGKHFLVTHSPTLWYHFLTIHPIHTTETYPWSLHESPRVLPLPTAGLARSLPAFFLSCSVID
jgi:hypothetical protein